MGATLYHFTIISLQLQLYKKKEEEKREREREEYGLIKGFGFLRGTHLLNKTIKNKDDEVFYVNFLKSRGRYLLRQE